MIRPKCPIVLGQPHWFILNPTIFNLIARPTTLFLESFWMDLEGWIILLIISTAMYTSNRNDICCDWLPDLFLEANQTTCIKLVPGSSRLLFWCSTATCPQPLFLWNFSAESVQLPGRENKKVLPLKCLLGGLAQTRNNWDSKAVVWGWLFLKSETHGNAESYLFKVDSTPRDKNWGILQVFFQHC